MKRDLVYYQDRLTKVHPLYRSKGYGNCIKDLIRSNEIISKRAILALVKNSSNIEYSFEHKLVWSTAVSYEPEIKSLLTRKGLIAADGYICEYIRILCLLSVVINDITLPEEDITITLVSPAKRTEPIVIKGII